MNPRMRWMMLGLLLALASTCAGLWLRRQGAESSSRPGGRVAVALPPIEHIAYRKTSEFDPGTIRVYLRNTGSREMAFRQVLLDGLAIPVFGVNKELEKPPAEEERKKEEKPDKDEHQGVYEVAAAKLSGKRVIWARLEPSPVPPGIIAEFAAKLADPLPRPMKVEFEPLTGEKLTAVVRPLAPALQITAITFGEKMDRIYIYMESRMDSPLAIERLELNGTEPGEGAWFFSRTLATGSKELAVVALKKPLTPGEPVVVRVACKEGFAAEERVRAFHGFPLNVENGTPPVGFGLDDGAYLPRHAAPELPGSFPRGTVLFECAMHKFGGDMERCGLEIMRRGVSCAKDTPGCATIVHICRIRPETGYALFAETTDILRMNPSVDTGQSRGKAGEPPEVVVERLSRFARLASMPRPFQVLTDGYGFGKEKELAEPKEFRRCLHAAIASGAKGLFYRYGAWSDPRAQALNEEIRRCNAEIGRLRAYLAIADVVEWANVEGRKDVTVRSLLAGQEALVLVVVRNHATAIDPEQGGRTVRIRLRLPSWFSAGRILAVAPEGLKEVGEGLAAGGTIELPVPEAAGAFVVRWRKQD